MDFRIIATFRVQQLLMLDDALQGHAGSPKMWNGRSHYRFEALSWSRGGIVLQEDLRVLAYCRTAGALLRSEEFSLPPLMLGSKACAWSEGWEEFLPPLLRYEQQFGPERLDLIANLPVPPIWRSAWWLELGSRVSGRLDHLLQAAHITKGKRA